MNHVGEDVEERVVGEMQGVYKGLLQEERSADTVGHSRGDGLCAWICPQVTEPVHTGRDEWVDLNSMESNVTGSYSLAFIECSVIFNTEC